jgi:hypothetical protein
MAKLAGFFGEENFSLGEGGKGKQDKIAEEEKFGHGETVINRNIFSIGQFSGKPSKS